MLDGLARCYGLEEQTFAVSTDWCGGNGSRIAQVALELEFVDMVAICDVDKNHLQEQTCRQRLYERTYSSPKHVADRVLIQRN